MAIPKSRKRAKELIEQICKDHGYLSEEKLQEVPPDTRRDIEEALKTKDEMIGSSVITLAKNLYTSKARFVFELLQNADDNNFSRAAAVGASPYISFRVFHSRIVVECNEDGFTKENLNAICSIGKSSKTGSEGYVGEKGVGFKSVFMAAWKAHIQSGDFSFSFSHRAGESGMGMISPIWEDNFEELESPLTRLTLHLHDHEDATTRRTARRIIKEQFEELQEAILLFMKNLKKIRVAFHDTDEVETVSVVYSIENPRSNHAVLKRTMVANKKKTEHVQHYHVTAYQATDIPRHKGRIYSSGAPSTSEVMVAFPISSKSVPVIKPQDLFAYLPVRKVGFNFIIQADFVTDASRQDIVRDSPRNVALLDAIARAFSRAVLQFCNQDGLRLRWMRYLPDRSATSWDTLWLSLVNKIADCLSRARVLYCHKKFDRHLIGDLVRLRDYVYDNEEPLFEDGDPEQIVSEAYALDDLEILMEYGLTYAGFKEVTQWLAADLQRGSQSRMKSPTTTANWHTKAAKLLRRPFSENLAVYKTELRNMKLLPLNGGKWVSATSGPVYFATTGGLDIPSHIGLSLINKDITNKHRKRLFEDLGVQTAPGALIRRKILEVYEQSGLSPDLSLQISKQHLQFLYLTHHSKATNEPSYSKIVLFDQDDRIRDPSKSFMYMATDKSSYSPWELLKEVGSISSAGREARGSLAHYFMNEGYFKESPQTPADQELTWAEWFHRYLEIPDYVHCGDTSLSDAAKYLQKHRPKKLLGALRIHHQNNQDLSLDFIACVRKTKVRCRDVDFRQLRDTYFPTKRLESLVRKFVEKDAFFPWLWLDKQTSYEAIPEIWDTFLTKFRSGTPINDLAFALDMLYYSLGALRGSKSPAGIRKLFNLYSFIHAQYRAAGGTSKAKTEIRQTFADEEAVCIPSGDSCDFVSPEECVWGAVQELDTKYALQIHFEALPFLDHESKRDLQNLFSRTLEIPDCTLEIYVEELKSLQESGREDTDRINVFYKEIHRLWRVDKAQQTPKHWLRSEFEDHALIYAASDEGPSWRKTSECVWSTAARLRGMVSLNNDYEALKEFFVDTLGVKPVTLKMAIDELKEAGSRQPASVEEVKASLFTVNSLLCSESGPRQLTLTECNIFPVRCTKKKVKCVSKRTEFFIGDRESLRSSFEDRVRFLDFNLEEIVQLHPFLNWARLEDRYISRSVRETTSIQSSDAAPISKYGHEFRHRAHAVLRIGKHFGSPRMATKVDCDALYEVLRNAKIFAADTISLELRVSQDGVSHKALGGSMNMHLREKSRSLKLYLPREKIPQRHAFSKHLPEKLLQWLMTEKGSQIPHQTSDKALIAMKDIWNTPVATISTTLDECGIVTISIANLDPEIEEISSDSEGDTVSETDAGDWSGSEAATQSDDNDDDSDTHSGNIETPPSAPETLYHDIASNYTSRNRGEPSTALMTHQDASTLRARSTTPDGQVPLMELMSTGDIQYVAVLEKIINSARTSTIPDRNEEGNRRLRGNEISAARRGGSRISGSTQFQRDCKIGAAGELFVFELLSRLDPPLPNFSRSNWKSNMRGYVSIHPTYDDMNPWTGRETSDITYRDTQGALTDLLIRNHYLDNDRWAGKTPHYFIEVKTTTSSFDAPFYMSNAQYERMKKTSLLGGRDSAIYVIFRVYQLDWDNQGPGLRVYVDPEALRLSGELDFKAQTWSVVPG